MFLYNIGAEHPYHLYFDTRGLKSSKIGHGTEWSYQSSFIKLLYHIYVLISEKGGFRLWIGWVATFHRADPIRGHCLNGDFINIQGAIDIIINVRDIFIYCRVFSLYLMHQ